MTLMLLMILASAQSCTVSECACVCVCVCGKLAGGMRRVSASVAAERFSGCLRSEYQSRLGRDPRFGAKLGSLRDPLWACCAGSTMRTAGFSELSVCSTNADVIAEPRLQVDLKVVPLVSLQGGDQATIFETCLFRLKLLLHKSSFEASKLHGRKSQLGFENAAA